MLRTVIFDIDGTLYDYDAAHEVAFSALRAFARGVLSVDDDRFAELHHRADLLLRQRCGDRCATVHNRLIRYQLMLELLEKPIGYAPAMADIYWTSLLGAMTPFEGVGETLNALHQRGLQVGVGTNMTADYQFAKLKVLGVLDKVDFMVTSEEAGAEKPDRRLFELCAEKACCEPSECVFVGDSLRGDVLGAMEAGMSAVWLCMNETQSQTRPDVRHIVTLPELIELIDQASYNQPY